MRVPHRWQYNLLLINAYFSHIETVDNLTFAVGLREDEDELEETIRKIIPM